MGLLSKVYCWIVGHEWSWTYTRNVGDEFDTRHGICSCCGTRWEDKK